MIDKERRAQILSRPKPEPPWRGEPLLGSIYDEREVEAAVKAIREATDIWSGFGFSATPIPEFEQAFAAWCGCKHAVAINSAGPGLDMMMRYLKLQPGEEVIVPAVNFQAAPLAVYGAGGQVVWGEIDPRTFQLDPADVEQKITPRTRAIFPVHMNGLSAPMDELIEVGQRCANDHGPIPVIGDAARACGGGYRGTKIGKKGLATVFSFHTMKNMVTLGEGGMVTTDEDSVADWCRAQRFYGAPIEEWGSSFVMTKVQAAVGLVQVEKLAGLIDSRRRLAHQRTELLADLPEIVTPFEPEDCEHSYYLYTCLVQPEWAGEKRDELIRIMADDYGVGCVVANPPVYLSRRLLREHTAGQSLPLSEEIGKRLFCVSIHPAMTEEDNLYAVSALIETVERLR